MTGELGILNVGAGDTKLVFDADNPQDCIRAARIVKDMLRRGYVLLVKIGMRDGKELFQRATDFDEKTCEYIIADFDPVAAEAADRHRGHSHFVGQSLDRAAAAVTVNKEETAGEEATAAASSEAGTAESGAKPRNGRKRRLPASGTRGVAVARSAGG